MNILKNTPIEDGFYMPAEFAPHRGTLMIWPERPGSWPYEAKKAREVFTEISKAIAADEELYMLVSEKSEASAKEMIGHIPNVQLVRIDTDDAWARDVGPTFVKNEAGKVRGINWTFNAWGGDFDGLYASWDKDDKVALSFLSHLGYAAYDASPFVLEGGSIHSDGEGTVIVTETCLLSKGRNPELSKEEIEERLKTYLGCQKVIWLPFGIYNDETNEHVDNVCAFVEPGKVVLAWTDDEKDPQYAMSKADYDYLASQTDAKDRKFEIVKLPIPKEPVLVKEEELEGYVFEEGEDNRELGERLAASYANFYITNKSILLPQFGDANDEVAVKILAKCYPDRKIVPIYARDIIVGGGNIHCITQQIPKGEN